MKPMQGKVAVVVGASRGIGMGAAIELGAAGAYVYAVGRTLKPGTGGAPGSLTESIEAIKTLGGEGQAVTCDCNDHSALKQVFAQVKADKGRLDVLVNNVFASHAFARHVGKRLWELEPEVWHDFVELPGRSYYFATALAAPLMMDTARTSDGGLIINVSGRGAERYRYNVAYGMGKSAISRLNRDVAIELKPHNVAVVALWPNGHTKDPPETPRYNGRGVVALATDAQRMRHTGQYFWTAQLAKDYGFTDEFGNHHPIGDLTDQFSLEHANHILDGPVTFN